MLCDFLSKKKKVYGLCSSIIDVFSASPFAFVLMISSPHFQRNSFEQFSINYANESTSNSKVTFKGLVAKLAPPHAQSA